MNLYQASFLKSVRQFPHNIALYTENSSTLDSSSSDTRFTYQELFDLSQRWGNYIAHLNKGQCPVAIYGGRQWQMYAGILATLSTNSAYVPLNNKQPANRNNKVLSQINCKVLLVAENEDPTALLHLTKHALEVIYLGDDEPKWLTNNRYHNCVKIEEFNARISVTQSEKHDKISITAALLEAESKLKTANNYAYILFTSGSTGTPKGIAVSHTNIVSHLVRLDGLLQLKATDKVSQFFELSFDLSVHDMFSCWGNGAALYVIPSEQQMCPLAFIKRHTLTVFSGVASILSFMDKLSLLNPQQLPHLRVSCFGGEKLLTSQALKWQQCAHNSRVLNIYGPTECTITATYYELSRNQTITSASVPIGKALSGLSAILVNNNKKVSISNTLAELYLAGDQLVDGYFQDVEKTKEAFITLNTSDEETAIRYYRTGDIVFYDEHKNIVFHGRNDHQFKVSGHRVEASEIEAAIVSFSTKISWCVVSAQTKVMGNTTIIAFIENTPENSPNIHGSDNEQQMKSALRTHCLQHLPTYMVPDEFFFYSYLPRNLSGKVDINVLLQNIKKTTVTS